MHPALVCCFRCRFLDFFLVRCLLSPDLHSFSRPLPSPFFHFALLRPLSPPAPVGCPPRIHPHLCFRCCCCWDYVGSVRPHLSPFSWLLFTPLPPCSSLLGLSLFAGLGMCSLLSRWMQRRCCSLFLCSMLCMCVCHLFCLCPISAYHFIVTCIRFCCHFPCLDCRLRRRL